MELEYRIYACILIKPSVFDEVDIDEKYFKTKSILVLLKNLYLTYHYIDVALITSKSNNIEKAIEFIVKCFDEEVNYKSINGYYKLLKEQYRDTKINEIAEGYKNREIDYKEFSKEMYYINKEDTFDGDEILTIDKISDIKSAEREYTEIPELDYLLKGIEYGKLSLWSGITNHGKTTLMIQFAKECIKKHKKVFYFSGEQTSQEFKNYLYVGMCAKEQLEFITDTNNSKIYDTKPKKEVIEYFDNIYKNDLFIYNNNIPNNNIDTMMKVMQKAFNQGVRIFFIDNFMQLDNSEKLEEQTKIVESFKRFARNNNVIINLVAHPRKTMFQKNRLTIFDISGTQNIANKSSNICTIMRTDLLPDAEYNELKVVLYKSGYDIADCDGIIEVLKTKGNYCKMVGLKYDFEKKIYVEAPKSSKKYDEIKTKRREV